MGAEFDNHLTNTTIVSPAQLYQVNQLKTDFALGYDSSESSTKLDGADETKASVTGTNLFAAGIYNVSNIGLRAGLTVNYLTGTTKSDVLVGTEMAEVEGDVSAMVLTPVVAYTAGPVVVGAALDIVSETAKIEDGDEAKGSSNIFRPGVLFADKGIEAGLTYTSPNRKDAEDTDELSQYNAAEVTAHGRYALTNDLAVGGILTNVNNKAIDEDLYKDQIQVTATAEMNLGAVKVDGDLGYNTAYYKNKDVMDTDSIGTIALGAGADYAVNKDTAVGGGLGYEFGSESANDTEYAVNDLTLAVRGNMKF
jgi:hypothetical protein